MPTYGEDILGLSNRRTRFLYVPLEKLRRGITAKDVELEIHRAAALISEGKVVPFSPETWLKQVSCDKSYSYRFLEAFLIVWLPAQPAKTFKHLIFLPKLSIIQLFS